MEEYTASVIRMLDEELGLLEGRVKGFVIAQKAAAIAMEELEGKGLDNSDEWRRAYMAVATNGTLASRAIIDSYVCKMRLSKIRSWSSS